MDIQQRNNLRAEADLPLLEIEAEAQKLAKAREEAAFELEWTRRRPEFAHLWEGNRDGWITGMGRYSLARQKVRRDMQNET